MTYKKLARGTLEFRRETSCRKWEAFVKALRIIQIILLLVVVAYLFLINNYNPNWTELPFLISLPSALVLAIGILLGYLAGWLFGRSGNWGKNRETAKLKKRLAELERQEPKVTAVNITRDTETPIIPDRTGTVQRGTSEYENL
jgi:protein-S-isoprenylcysteine O-methyltransferase Ste14